MSIVTTIGDFFRSATKDKNVKFDKYDILSPLMSVQEYVEKTKELLLLIQKDPVVLDILKYRRIDGNKVIGQAVAAYQTFVKNLPSQFHKLELDTPFKVILSGLVSIQENLSIVEHNFPNLFGDSSGEFDEENIRSSSLVIIGYIETASEFCTWLGALVRHLTAEHHDLIPPFETKVLGIKAARFGSFLGFNLVYWDSRSEGILTTVKNMQKKGADVAIKSGDNWIDSFVHDNQFSPMESELLSASLRSPFMWVTSKYIGFRQAWLDLLVSEKDWMIAKIAFESERLRGMDPNSAEYKKLRKITDRYADLISKHQQKIERMRA